MGEYLKTVPEVTDFQAYVGTASPYNFNGLVRHYFLRSGGNVADIQVNFVAKGDRKAQSHDIAKRLRPGLKKIGDRYRRPDQGGRDPAGSAGSEYAGGRDLWPGHDQAGRDCKTGPRHL